VHGTNPIEDAIGLIERVLEGPENIRASQLHVGSGLPLRRFNPALAFVLGHIDERRVSQVWDNDYPARSFLVVAEDRVALRRVLAQLEGEELDSISTMSLN
jgi:hypothetical protein